MAQTVEHLHLPASPAREDQLGKALHPCRSGAELANIQFAKLQTLLQTLLPANSFYREKLGLAVAPPVSFEQFARLVPFTTKHELMRDRLNHPPYGTNLTYPVSAYVRCHQTSGSTAVPIRWLDTASSWNHLVENWIEILNAAGVTQTDRFFFAFSFGPFLGFWSALEAVQKLGCFFFAGGSMTSIARVEAILDNGITVLCCTPTYAQHLGEVAAEKNFDLERSKVRLIIVAGEAGGSIPATRARIERLWPGATVFDHHGMTEVGPVTFQCPAQPGILHVLETAYVAEVVEPSTGTPLNYGETGELVLTTLDRLGSPLLRYRTGDLVKFQAPGVCRCGRSELALEGGILGRSDDMAVIRGVNVYPSLVETIVRGIPEIAEYRARVDTTGTMAELRIELEPASGLSCEAAGALGEQVTKTFRDRMNLRVMVEVLPGGSLPRFEMKAQRWFRA